MSLTSPITLTFAEEEPMEEVANLDMASLKLMDAGTVSIRYVAQIFAVNGKNTTLRGRGFRLRIHSMEQFAEALQRVEKALQKEFSQ